jgi:flotillin
MSAPMPVFAQISANIPTSLVLSIALGLLAFSLLVLFAKRYKRCPSNRLLVIYGKTGQGAAKVIHGGAAFVWPLIQAHEFLPLDPFVVPIDLSSALSQENIRVSVPTTVTVAVSTETGVMENAAVRLLGLPTNSIRDKAEDIILGQMRAVIATMRIEEINQDRQAFMIKVYEAVTTELEKIGLAVINTNIKDIEDESGYIKALGQKAAAEAIQQAEIDVAEAKRRGETGVAELERDRRKAVASAKAEAEIAEAEAEKIQRSQVSAAHAGAEIGEGDADRDKRQQLAQLEAKAVETETKAEADKAGFRAAQRIAEEGARSEAESASRTADGDIRASEEAAQKRAEDARAAREESRLNAEVVVPAEARKKRVIVDAEAQRQQSVVVAKGDAEARLARARAEGEGIKAVLDGKAAGYRGLVQGVGGSANLASLLIVEKLGDLTKIQAEAIQGLPIEKIVIWDGGSGDGIARVGKQIMGVLPPIHELAKQAGLDLPDYLGRFTEDDKKTEPSGPSATELAARARAGSPPPPPTPPKPPRA